MKGLIDKLLEYYKLKNLIRYNHRVRIKDESVAEHSYFVSLFTILICHKLQVNDGETLNALTYALIHDIPEIEISDIPHSVKSLNPELKRIIFDLEYDAIKKILPSFTDILFKCESGQMERVKAIVDLADVLSVLQYCALERRLGNTTLLDIEKESNERYLNLTKNLNQIFKVKLKWTDILGNI